MLLVIGTPGTELAAAVDVVWRQMPRPRHRVTLLSEEDLEEGFAAAADELATAAEQAEETTRDTSDVQAQPDRIAPMDHARHEATAAVGEEHHSGHEGMESGQPGHQDMGHSGRAGMTSARKPGHEGMDHSGHEGMDHSDHEGMDHSDHGGMEPAGGQSHGGMDHSCHGGMDHSGHGGMDHSGHHMNHGGDVAGLPMAETAPDRDGLSLDVLRVSLGPVLPDWLTGLLLRAELQGDVLTGAELSWLDAGDDAAADEGADPRRAALDHLASLLAVAGWSTAARDARRARDGLASTDPDERRAAEQGAQRVIRRVRRSRPLAWSLRGIGCLADPDGTTSDVLDRLRRWCEVAADGAAGSGLGVLPLDVVANVLRGAEVAAARLIVASVELQRSLSPAEPEVVGA